ncbi:hypothetical protein B0H13DRAFT_1924324 [Mycena leptocephala]|nr:hypothetical protein B0H13DRAFT_1924324 [Mycena leptocephala]
MLSVWTVFSWFIVLKSFPLCAAYLLSVAVYARYRMPVCSPGKVSRLRKRSRVIGADVKRPYDIGWYKATARLSANEMGVQCPAYGMRKEAASKAELYSSGGNTSSHERRGQAWETTEISVKRKSLEEQGVH